MVHLAANTSPQTAYFSPFQARKFLADFSDYLVVITSSATSKTYACILNVVADNARYTSASLPTDSDDPTNGSLLLTDSGLYSYTIYGQNSSTNLDPKDAVVVGICESGMLRVTAEDAWDIPSVTIPNNVIYYE
jgi:hypothetical protein